MKKKLAMYFEDACDMLDNLDIEYGPVTDVTINYRATSRWGQCRRNRFDGTYTIEISSRLLEDNVSYDAAMDTVVHELLHCHKDRMCHTGEWKRCANLVNMVYNLNIKRCTSAAEKNLEDTRPMRSAKYRVKCENCGNTFDYSKKSKVIQLLMRYPENHGCTCRCGSSKLTLYTL